MKLQVKEMGGHIFQFTNSTCVFRVGGAATLLIIWILENGRNSFNPQIVLKGPVSRLVGATWWWESVSAL